MKRQNASSVKSFKRIGFTLVELLVVISIIGLLIAMLLPAVQAVREAARRSQCSNNLKQLGLAIHNHESAKQYFPPSATIDWSVTVTGNNGSWGVHGRILPYLEQANLYDQVDLNTAWDFQLAIDGLKIPVFSCPSDAQADEIRVVGTGRPNLYPTSYGFNFGTWFVVSPTQQDVGDGMFFPNSNLKFADCLDGTSHTLVAADVKAWTPYNRNGGPSTTSIPANQSAAESIVTTGTDFKTTGHTEWPDGRVHHTGFTVTLAPNSNVNFTKAGILYPQTDYNSWQEGRNGKLGNPTYAIVTARSYHPGVVNAVFVDGSVRPVANEVDVQIWRALGTRAGGEVTGFE